MINRRRFAVAFAFTALFAFSACSSLPQNKGDQVDMSTANDPFESVNRTVFDVNDFLDRLLIRPMAELYRVMIPPPLRDRIASVLKNMSEPVIMANNLFQGEFTNAGTSLSRLVVNSTLGGGGMFEVASSFGLTPKSGDFGQTLYVWGFKDGGPYIVLPLFGPSNVRDAIGLGVDSALSPWKYAVGEAGGNSMRERFEIADTVGSGIVTREENIDALDALREGSLDFYAQMRSVYRQHRAKELGAPLPSDTPLFEDYEAEPSKTIVH